MDEIRVWNVARSGHDIYGNLSCTLTGTETNLAGYWNFDDGTANDLTGHGHNGTVIGNAQVVPIQGGDVIHANCGPLRLDGISLTSDLLPLINLSGPTGFLYRVDVSPNLSDWLPWSPSQIRAAPFR